MTQLSLVSGVLAKASAQFRTSYPINMEANFTDTQIGKGTLRVAAGCASLATGPGLDRASIMSNGVQYRVMGTKLVSVAGSTVTVQGDVGGSGYAAMDQSFDRLAVASGGKLYYLVNGVVSQVTDPDLGTVIDMLWVDGYFMCTDGTYVVVTELDDPFSVKPLKYGSAEDSPDGITGLIRVPGSADTYVCGTNTIQAFQNVGGNGFPFKTIKGATIPVGCVSASAKCLFGKTFAFVGSGLNQALGVYVAGQGDASKISTQAVDDALAACMGAIFCEQRVYGDEIRLYVHLPTESWVFLAKASEKAGEAVWYKAQSGVKQPYRLRNALYDGARWVVGDVSSGQLGVMNEAEDQHFGEAAQWRFDVGMAYSAKPAILHSVELVGLPGRDNGTIWLSYTQDAVNFSIERSVAMTLGRRRQRICWRPHVRISTYIGMRFRGFGLEGVAACEVNA